MNIVPPEVTLVGQARSLRPRAPRAADRRTCARSWRRRPSEFGGTVDYEETIRIDGVRLQPSRTRSSGGPTARSGRPDSSRRHVSDGRRQRRTRVQLERHLVGHAGDGLHRGAHRRGVRAPRGACGKWPRRSPRRPSSLGSQHPRAGTARLSRRTGETQCLKAPAWCRSTGTACSTNFIEMLSVDSYYGDEERVAAIIRPALEPLGIRFRNDAGGQPDRAPGRAVGAATA